MNAKPLDILLATRVGISMLMFSLAVGAIAFWGAIQTARENASTMEQHLVAAIQLQAEIAVFANNTKIAQEITEGLLATPLLARVRIETAGGPLVDRSERSAISSESGKQYPLYSPIDRNEQIGKLILFQNSTAVETDALRAAIRQTLSLLVQIAVAVAVTLWVVRKKVVGPVARFSEELEAILPGSSRRLSPTESSHARELHTLERSANHLLEATEIALRDEREIRALHEISAGIARVGGWEYTPTIDQLNWSQEVYRIHERQPTHPITTNEAIGYFLGDAGEVFRNALNTAATEGISFNLELPLRTDSGRQIWVRIQGQKEILATSNPRVLGALQDITDRKIAEAEVMRAEQRMALVFRTSPVAICIARVSDGRFTEVNDAFLRLIGRKRHEVLRETSLLKGIWPNEETRSAWLQEVLATGTLIGFEHSFSNAQGIPLTVLMSTSLTDFAGEPCLVTFLIDVTERRQMEHALEEYRQRLEEKVEERTHAAEVALGHLQKTREELVRSEAQATLSTLIASVSHELNTPIGTSVLMSTTLTEQVETFQATFASGSLKKSQFEDFLENVHRGSELIQRNLQRAELLMQKFRQVAADQVSEQRRVFNLQTVVRDLVDSLTPSLKRQPHRIEMEIAENISLDSYPGPLGQVVINLINNAYLHAFDGRSNGVVRIVAQSEPSCVLLTIADNGRGMAPDVQAKIFEPFFSTKIGLGGTGLGMSIVDNLVRKPLGGTLTLKSTEGIGTAIELRLPVVAPTEGRPERE